VNPDTPSIVEHFPTLTAFASKSKCLVELGCRYGNGSTRAFRRGVQHPLHTWTTVDIVDLIPVEDRPTELDWKMIVGSSIDPEVMRKVLDRGMPDLVFIDTLHTYDQMKAELALWVPAVTCPCTWLFHDTWMHGRRGAVRDAITDYADSHLGAKYRDLSKENNGLGMMVTV